MTSRRFASAASEMLSRAMSEDDLENKVAAFAIAFKWMVHAERPARTAHGWRTPVKGHKGFPDLTIARDGFVIFAELKTERGAVAPEQVSWLTQINGHPADDYHDLAGSWLLRQPRPLDEHLDDWPDHAGVLWRPRDWPTIEKLLRI